MKVKLLGSAAGGGFPQWNCACTNCRGIREGALKSERRSQTQVAIGTETGWFLLDASPDLRSQLDAFPDLAPSNGAGVRQTAIGGIFLTSCDVDRIMGLLHLREFQRLDVYGTNSLRQILMEDNSMFGVLRRESEQLAWHSVLPDRLIALPSEQAQAIEVQTIGLASKFPEYVSGERANDLSSSEATLGLQIRDLLSGKTMIYLPSLPATNTILQAKIAACDLLLLDGTFWQDSELIHARGAGRTAREMGHVPMAGSKGTLAWLKDVKAPRKVYIHINNTNPVLNEASPEFAECVSQGWTIAKDGMEFEL